MFSFEFIPQQEIKRAALTTTVLEYLSDKTDLGSELVSIILET